VRCDLARRVGDRATRRSAGAAERAARDAECAALVTREADRAGRRGLRAAVGVGHRRGTGGRAVHQDWVRRAAHGGASRSVGSIRERCLRRPA